MENPIVEVRDKEDIYLDGEKVDKPVENGRGDA